MRVLTFSVFAALLSAPAFAADLGTYRPGTPYNSTVAGGADVCDNQCAGDAQCRGWNYVKPNPRAAGVCEFLSSVSTPISSQISISGENRSAAPYYSGLTTGATNTVRVGTQPPTNTVQVGQAPSTRRVVRQAVPQRAAIQQASTPSVENMSLTAQQNRYRQGQARMPQNTSKPMPQAAPQIQAQRQVPAGRAMFRPILDASQPQVSRQQTRQPRAQTPRRETSRRVTGPRRFQDGSVQGRGTPTPQFQNPQVQNSQLQDPRFQAQQLSGRSPQAYQTSQAPQQRGQSRPPIGQPIPAPRRAATPSQRLAQLTAQTQASSVPVTGPVALSPQQARKSLFGSLNDDVPPSDAMPTASAVPTQPVFEQPLGEVLAGGR